MENKDFSEERKVQILSAAMKEFAEKGYEQASTNTICKEAEVSKGLLFHYFGNKKNLYLEVLDICISKYQQINDRVIMEFSEDIVERIFQIMEMKIITFTQDPASYSIILDAFINLPKDLQNEILDRQNRLHQMYLPKLYSNLDFSRFRPEIDSRKALELITLVTDGLSQKYIQKYKQTKDKNSIDLHEFRSELEIYIEMLKKGIYHH